MPKQGLGARSQQFPGLQSTSISKDTPVKRPRDEFIDTRFRFTSAASQSKKLKPNLSNLVSSHNGLTLESEEKQEHECHFTSALQTASLDNLSNPFKRLHRTIEPITRSLPLLIYHQEQVVHACCQALIVSDSPSSADQPDRSPQATRLSGKNKRNQSSDLEKERKRHLIQAKEAVNLVATSVLDLFVPLILDLSTSLLTPSNSPTNLGRCPFEELLITLLYFINLTDVEPTALSKAPEVIVHLFKTLAKDLTPSLSSNDHESDENSHRLKSIWNLVRNALGAPLPDYQELTKVDEETPEGEGSDSEIEDDVNEVEHDLLEDPTNPLEEPTKPIDEEIEDADIDSPEFNQVDPNDATKPLDELTPDGPKEFETTQLLHQVLKSTTPSSRRLVATSFSYLLRKKGISEPLIRLMLNDLNTVEGDEIAKHGTLQARKQKVQVARKGTSVRSLLGEEHGGARVFAEGICWALGETCKSIDHRLHSRASAILIAADSQVVETSLRAQQKSLQQPILISSVLSSLLISIIHHTTAQYLEPVLEALTTRTTERLDAIKPPPASSSTETSSVALETSLHCLATVAGVRNGSRLSPTKKPTLFKILGSMLGLLSDEKFNHTKSLSSTTALLSLNLLSSIKDHSEFLGTPENRKVLDKIFQLEHRPLSIEHVFKLASSLHRMNWSLFDDFLLPKLLAIIPDQLSHSNLNSSSESTASLLSDLLSTRNSKLFGKLFDLISSKMEEATKVILDHLSSFHLSSPNTPFEQPASLSMSLKECYDWVSISSLLPIENTQVKDNQIEEWCQQVLIIPSPSDQDVPENLRRKYISDYESGAPINRTMLLSIMMNVARRLFSDQHSCLRAMLLDGLPFIAHVWGWHREMLKIVRDICEDVQKSSSISLSFESMYQPLKAALLSESHVIRHLTLEILLTTAPPASPLESLLKQCLKIEDTPLLVENARIRQMHIRKLSTMVQTNGESVSSTDIVDLTQRVLIAQLKVHFQPLWEESIQSLTNLNSKYHVNFWTLVWGQLDLCLRDSSELYFTPRVQLINQTSEDHTHSSVSRFTDQPEFRCTHLDKLVDHFSSDFRNHTLIAAFEYQSLDSRLDIQSYEAHLVDLLSRNRIVAEKHNRLIIEAFFSYCQAKDEDLEQGHLLGRSARSRLRNWLRMFSKFTNPKAFHRAQDLRVAFYDLLADPDSDLRSLSLECVLTWQDSSLVRHQDDFRNLLDTSQFRDTLLKMAHAIEDHVLPDHEREQVIPVFIRILFGALVVSPGRSSSSHSKSLKKSAILSAFKGCSIQEIDLLVELMLRPLTSSGSNKNSSASVVKRQLGFLSLLGDVMKTLGRQLVHRWEDFLNQVMRVVLDSQSHIHSLGNDVNSQHVFLESQLKKVRVQTLHRLNDFFQLSPPSFSFAKWINSIFEVLINPRLASFAAETAQAPSALLEIFHTWSGRKDLMPMLIQYNSQVLTSVYQTLAIVNVKAPVVKTVIAILENILRNLELYPAELTAEQYLKPYFDVLLPNLAELLRKASYSSSLTASISRQQIALLSTLAPYITETNHSERFCELILPLLLKNQVVVPEHIQADLLLLLSGFLSTAPRVASSASCFNTLSKLLGTVMSRKGRLSLVGAVDSICHHSNHSISPRIIKLLQDLNSFSTKRIDEPDFERRLNAFSRLNNSEDESSSALTPKEWELLIQHSLFQIRDPDELSLRGSAASALCRFLDLAESNQDAGVQMTLKAIMIPGLKKVLRSKLEIIRQEALTVFAVAVAKQFPTISELEEMRCLLVDGDKEANFFLNIYHIQVHRRIRALRRLGDEVEAGRLSSKGLLDIFLPLLAHIFLPTDSSRTDPDLVNEAIRAIGRITKVLNWSAYNAVLQFYVKLIHKPTAVNKITVRVVVSIMKSFHFNLHEQSDPAGTRNLTSTPEHALGFVSGKLIPSLIKFMEQQKEDGPDESLRIMIGEGVAFVATFLPESASQNAISGIISSLSNILKSTHQETRQSARATVGNIVILLPASFLAQVLKDLKAVLLRGPQLHVLAHTTYSILSRASESSNDFEIDSHASKLLMSIIIDDLFGQPWRDRQSKELKAKTKFNETKTSRSLESLQMIVSKLANSDILTDILVSFQQVLENTGPTKILKQVDECFHRICAGIVANKEKFDAPKVLDLSKNLISENAEYLKNKSQKKKSYVINPTDHRVVLSTKSKVHDGHYAANAHHFVSLGLDLFNTVYRRAVFDLHSPEYLPMIDQLVSVVGNTLYTHNTEVLARGLKVMSILIKLPLPEVERSATIIVRQMLSVVNHIGTSQSEISQVALKSLGTVIRDCKKVELTEKQLTDLLKMIVPDLEDSDRQTTLFALLRGIMSKKFMAPELYDLMDQILRLLVTAQSNQVREICRSIFLQFLLDYPQGKGRLSGSLQFLVKNLAYQHESGRQSVLEILNAINMKFSSALVSQNSDLFFVALVMRVANEGSVKCKEMAIEVLKVICRRIELGKAGKYLDMLLTWSQNQNGPVELRRTALQLLGVVIEARGAEDKTKLESVHSMICVTLEKIAADFMEEESDVTSESTGLDWQTIYYSLQALSKLFTIDAGLICHPTPQNKFPEWSAIQKFMLFPHAWVRSSAARLIGTLLSASVDEKLWLFQTDNLLAIAQKSSLQLRSQHLDDALALQIVKNLFFLLKTLHERLKSNAPGSNIIDPTSDNPPAVNGAQPSLDNEDDQSDSEEDDHQHENQEPKGTGTEFIRLIKRLSRQASIAHAKRPSVYSSDAGRWSIEAASVLRCFAALINHLSVDDLSGILRPLMIPIFRIIEDSNIADPQMEELQNLAKEVQEFLRDKVGTTKFSLVYGQLRTIAIEKRQARKKLIALKAVNQPESSAKRKISRSESKLRNKKRKQESFSRQNSMYGKSKAI
ncbi:U3 snoRNP protein [Puccinia graminis f. sp. tritici]|uniref:U3 snoRNP protein n=1 Tax=Puccinia graminis f. sp. tritici TaxID=56615 RepID=A0A5B0QXD6_PUCGR|nr:U3 snoRNP protein [Puccinia graminis f. sp. tritici]